MVLDRKTRSVVEAKKADNGSIFCYYSRYEV